MGSFAGRSNATVTTQTANAPERAETLIAQYLAHLAHERRLAEHSTLAYRRDIRILLECAQDTRLEDLSLAHIRRIVAMLHGRGLSGRTLARMLSAWRGFYRYLAENHGLRMNPCVGIRAPKNPKRLPDALTADEAQRLVETPGESTFAVRDRAMLELFYSSGLRLAELAGIDWTAIDMTDGTARVYGKGAKTRVVPVGRQALQALRAWRAARKGFPPADENAVFVNRRGRRLSMRMIQVRIKAAGMKQGISLNVHPHMLRHSFASHILQSSGDLRAVQEMLGHASITTTQIYTHLDFQHLAKAYDAAHPRAKRRSTK